MYAVINHLHLNVPIDQMRPGLVEEGLPLIEALPGFQGIYMIKTDNDQATIIILWDSATNAENGAKTIGHGWFAQNIAPYLASPQQRSVGEVSVQRLK